MVCKKCGKKLDKNEEFCSVCGYYNDPNEEAITEEDKGYDDDYFDEIKESDELDDEFDLDDIKDANNNIDIEKAKKHEDINEMNLDEETDVVDANLINGFNISDSEEIEEFSTKSTAKTKKKLSNFKDDRLIEAFTGEDYKWIIRRPFNIYAFFLSWIYFLYRKIYIIGLIGLVITGLVYRFYTSYIIPYAIVVMLISGFIFNPIYKAYANFRINRIKKHNYGTDDFTIEQICSEKGGTSLIITLLIFLVFLMIMIRTYYSFSINTENTKFWTENSENKANCTSIAKADYKLLDESQVIGILDEGVCNVRTTNSTKSYDVYLKITNKETNTFKIIFFKDEKQTVTIEGVGVNLEELQEKNRSSLITEEETKVLNRTLEIRKEYTKVHDASIEDDNLIKKRKNTTEKKNYIISKDEILR